MMLGNETKEMLVQFAERIQKLDEEVAKLKEDRKEIMKEAKDAGFETKHINAAIREIRKIKKDASSKDVETIYIEILSEANIIDLV